MLQRRVALGPGGGIHRLLGAGAGVVVIQPQQVGVDDPQLGQRLGHVLLVGEGDVEVIVHGGACVAAAVGQLGVAAPQLPQIVQRRQGQGGERYLPLGAQLHQRHALVLACLGEGVFQRRAAVAHRLPPHLLGAVEVPQSHVVEPRKEGGVHTVQPAHRGLLALAGGGPGHKLVGHQHAAAGGVGGAAAQHAGQRIVVALGGLRRLVRVGVADEGGLQKGQ